MSYERKCRHCGDWVPHDAPSAVCGRCACLPVAERGRTPQPAAVPISQTAPEPLIRPDRTTDCGPDDPLRPYRLAVLARSFGALANPQPR